MVTKYTSTPDIFDELSEELSADPFDNVSSTEDDALEKIKNDLSSLIEKLDTKDRRKQNGALVNEVKNFVRAELSKVKPTQNVIERQIQQVVKHEQTVRHVQVPMEPKVIKAPPQIIREVRVEVPAKDGKTYAEEKTVTELKAELAQLKEQYQRLVETLPMMGGSGVIGIPPPEAAPDTYVLTNDKGKAKWKAAAAGGSVTPSGDTYVVSGLTKQFNYDATNVSLDEIASVLGALIASCRTSGIVS